MKTSFWAIQNVLLTAGLCVATLQLRAQTIAYDVPKGTTGNLAVPEFGVGNDFKVLSPIVISQLGVFDSGGNGIQGGMVLGVQLYERGGRHNGMLLESMTFDAVNPGKQIGGSLFKPLPLPVTLLPGNYTIAAYGFDTNNPVGDASLPPFNTTTPWPWIVNTTIPPWTLNTGGGLIRADGLSRYGGVGLYPAHVARGPAIRYAAGTFMFTGTTLPNPPCAADYAALTAGVSSFPIGDTRHLGSIAVLNVGSFPILVENGGNRNVLEAAGYYNNDPAGARAVVFAHTQWENAPNDSRMTLFENAVQWAAKKTNPANIVMGVTTDVETNISQGIDINYFISRGYNVIPISLQTLNATNPLPAMDVLVADWHTHYDPAALAQIELFNAAGGGLVMSAKPRFIVYPRILQPFFDVNEILQPFGLAYRSSLATPADYALTNIQSIPFPAYFSAFPAAEMLHADRIGQYQMDSFAKAIALNTINYAGGSDPQLLSALMAVYSGTTNNGTVQLPQGESVNFMDVVTMTGVQASTNRLGNWTTNRTGLVAANRRGSVEYDFNVPAADLYKLRIEATQNVPFNPSDNCTLLLTLDGQSLGRQYLTIQPGVVSAVECWTPYILPGPHSLRIVWDNAESYTALELVAVHVQIGLGPDENGNGIKDWVDQLVQTQSGMDNTNSVIGSYTSPLCLEGRDPYPPLMQMQVVGADNHTYSASPNATSDHRWFINVPLSAYVNAQTLVEASYQSGALTETRNLQWLPINILAATNNLTIRKGDSLLLNAFPAGATNGILTITIGTNQYHGHITQPIACSFPAVGVYTMTGTYTPAKGAASSGSMSVDVVGQDLTNSPACWVGMERNWGLPHLAPEAALQADSRLFFEPTATLTNHGELYGLLADENEPRTIIARLGQNGPILDATQARGFNLWSGSQAYTRVIQTYPDGSELVEMMVICSPVLPDVTFEIDTIVGGITFDDGTTTKILTASSFDAVGRCLVHFIRPATARTSVCHSIKAFQGTDLAGYLP